MFSDIAELYVEGYKSECDNYVEVMHNRYNSLHEIPDAFSIDCPSTVIECLGDAVLRHRSFVEHLCLSTDSDDVMHLRMYNFMCSYDYIINYIRRQAYLICLSGGVAEWCITENTKIKLSAYWDVVSLSKELKLGFENSPIITGTCKRFDANINDVVEDLNIINRGIRKFVNKYIRGVTKVGHLYHDERELLDVLVRNPDVLMNIGNLYNERMFTVHYANKCMKKFKI